MEAVARFAEKGIVASPLWPMNSIHQCFPWCSEKQPGVIFVPNGFWVGQDEREQIASGIKAIFGGAR
jgi:hypothetical protein